jgi:hypothetical protein
MIDNNLERALGALERHAPAEDEVLAGMRAGIVRRRRHRQLATVAGVAAVVGALALGAVYLAPTRDAGQTALTPAAPPAKTGQPQAPAPPTMPFTAAWIPDGYKLDTWEAGSTEASAQYVGSKDFQTVVVWISAKHRDKVAGDTEEPTTIAGRPGVIRRLNPDGKETQLIWQLEDGRWIMVGGRAPVVTLDTLRRVADNVAIRPTPVAGPFTLTSLPDGYQGLTWMAGSGPPVAGSVTMCKATTLDARAGLAPDCISIAVGTGAAPTTVLVKKTKETGTDTVPIDQEQTVNGLLTRATADGHTAVAQLDPDHWAQANSQQAGVDLLRQVLTTVRP